MSTRDTASPERGADPSRAGYRGRLIAVGTRHAKERQFAPAFSAVLGARLLTPAGLDTDRFGTFSGETPRRGTALEAARGKARLAMAVTGLPLGLASEASYGPMPGSGFAGHEEILLFCDDDTGIEVIEGLRSPAVPGRTHQVSGVDELPAALIAGLPGQGLIVRAATGGAGIVKGITDAAALHRAVRDAVRRSPDGRAWVEPDLRAHHNPSRREVLRRLAERMAHRLTTQCPACSAPGFGRVDSAPGLPCRDCDTPTPSPAAEIHACAACAHRVSLPAGPGAAADPALCPACNP